MPVILNPKDSKYEKTRLINTIKSESLIKSKSKSRNPTLKFAGTFGQLYPIVVIEKLLALASVILARRPPITWIHPKIQTPLNGWTNIFENTPFQLHSLNKLLIYFSGPCFAGRFEPISNGFSSVCLGEDIYTPILILSKNNWFLCGKAAETKSKLFPLGMDFMFFQIDQNVLFDPLLINFD